MDLSIIIVNWNSKDYLQQCIATVLAGIHAITYELLVIDSASFDGCEKMLREQYPHVQFIQSSNNVGFAKANNEAFSASRGRYILFLNPDTEVEGGAIESLFRFLESLPDAGIVGPKLLNSDRSVQTSCIQAFPTVLNQFLDAEALRRRFPQSGLWGMKPLFASEVIPAEVDAVSGASLMIKRTVFERVGMFSTDYFMYSEDIDLCYKVKDIGYGTYYIPTAVVVHHGGASSAQSAVNTFASVMILESRWRFFRKTRSLLYCLGYRASVCIACIGRIAVILLSLPISGTCGKNVIKKWNARLRWSLGAERWVKNY